ncbi:hypothetical protein QJS66_17230 [Kocuria rhizophila]|nr:hypothetical protein QJS66_17230 [Kocuria rhizophila]
MKGRRLRGAGRGADHDRPAGRVPIPASAWEPLCWRSAWCTTGPPCWTS